MMILMMIMMVRTLDPRKDDLYGDADYYYYYDDDDDYDDY